VDGVGEDGSVGVPRQRVDSPQVAAWKERMQTDEAKEIHKLRGSTIETINGDRNDHRGLNRFRVRGLQRVRCVLVSCVLMNPVPPVQERAREPKRRMRMLAADALVVRQRCRACFQNRL
jgi:hypothetical protein